MPMRSHYILKIFANCKQFQSALVLSRLLKIYSTWHLNTTCKWFQLNHAPGNNLLCNFRAGGTLEGRELHIGSARIQLNISTNINAFHVYIFPVTSVWITLQRDDILRQGKPATLSRQSINQRKIIRNILHKAPATRHWHWYRGNWLWFWYWFWLWFWLSDDGVAAVGLLECGTDAGKMSDFSLLAAK